MHRPHVAIFNVPHPGHINPSLAIVVTLLRRGYRVSYVTSKRFAERISKLGANVLPGPAFIPNCYKYTSGDEEAVGRDHFECARITISNLTDRLRSDKPDFIIYELGAYAGVVIGNMLDIPVVATSACLSLDREDWYSGRVPSEWGQVAERFRRSLDDFLRGYGFNGSDALFRKEALTIYLYVRELQISRSSFGPNCFYAGRAAGEQPHEGCLRLDSIDDSPTLLLTASTAYVKEPVYFIKYASALVELGCHVIVAIGDNNDPASFDGLPSGCEILQGVSQIRILPFVDLIIGFAGLTTTMEAMYHGVPMLMLTGGHLEGEVYADNVARLGLGTHLRGPDVSPSEVREAAGGLLVNGVARQKVHDMQELVKRSSGAEDTVNRIEEYVRRWPIASDK